MNELTKDDLREIEQIHSNWIEYEVAGDSHSIIALCADDIELCPPDERPLLGRAAVSAQMAREKTKIHSVEITDRRIRGSSEIVYFYRKRPNLRFHRPKTRPADKPSEAICGCCDKRAGTWVVTLVSWSVWGSADTSATSQPPLFPSTGVTP